jgi:hypothetical protein
MDELSKRIKLMQLAILPLMEWSAGELELANKYIIEEAKWELTARSKFVRNLVPTYYHMWITFKYPNKRGWCCARTALRIITNTGK